MITERTGNTKFTDECLKHENITINTFTHPKIVFYLHLPLL